MFVSPSLNSLDRFVPLLLCSCSWFSLSGSLLVLPCSDIDKYLPASRLSCRLTASAGSFTGCVLYLCSASPYSSDSVISAASCLFCSSCLHSTMVAPIQCYLLVALPDPAVLLPAPVHPIFLQPALLVLLVLLLVE